MSYSDAASPNRNANAKREPAYEPAEIFQMDDIGNVGQPAVDKVARSPPASQVSRVAHSPVSRGARSPSQQQQLPRGPWRGATPTLGDILGPALQAADRVTIDLVSPSPPPSAPPAAALNVTPMRKHATHQLEDSPGGAETVARERHGVLESLRRAESIAQNEDAETSLEERARLREERRALRAKVKGWESRTTPRPEPSGTSASASAWPGARRSRARAPSIHAMAAPVTAPGQENRFSFLDFDEDDGTVQGGKDGLQQEVEHENEVNGNAQRAPASRTSIAAPVASVPAVIPLLAQMHALETNAPNEENDVFGPAPMPPGLRVDDHRRAATATAHRISATTRTPAPAPSFPPLPHLPATGAPSRASAERAATTPHRDIEMPDAVPPGPAPAAAAPAAVALPAPPLPPRGSGVVVRNAPASDMDRSWAARIHPLLARTLRKLDTSTDNSLIAGLNENGFWEGIRATQKFHWDSLDEDKIGMYVVSVGGRDARGMDPLTVTRAAEDALGDCIGPAFPGAKPKVSPADFVFWPEDKEPRPTLLVSRLPPGAAEALRVGTMWAFGDLCAITFDYKHGPSTYLGTISTSMEATELATVTRDEYCADARVIEVCNDIARHHPNEPNNHLRQLYDTISVVQMDIMTPRSNIPKTVYHVHADVPLLRGHFYPELRSVLRSIEIVTNMDGIIKMSPVRKCSTCTADDHPFGMCRARSIRGWDVVPPTPAPLPAPPPSTPLRGTRGYGRGAHLGNRGGHNLTRGRGGRGGRGG